MSAAYGFPLESVGFADAALFGPVMMGIFFTMMAVLGVAIGEVVVRMLLAPHPRHA